MQSMKDLAVTLLLMVYLILTGCGGGGGSSSTSTSSTQTPVTWSISGTITDNDSKLGIAGVTVTLDSASGSAITTTDAGGNYMFSGLSNGTYLVTPTKTGTMFQSPSTTVTVTSSNLTGINFVGTTHGGQVLGLVADTGGQPLSPVTINVYNGTTLVSTKTNDVFGSFAIFLPPGTYRFEFSKPNFKTAVYNNVVVTDGVSFYIEMIFMIHNSFITSPSTGLTLYGDISGRISNAVDGLGVSGLTVNLREGLNNTTGTVVATTTTANEGAYTFIDPVTGAMTLPGGNYTAEVTGAGFMPVFFSVRCLGGQGTDNQNMTVAPIGASGLIRVVLTWYTHRDLDSHLTGPTDTPPSRFHIYYAKKSYSDTLTTASLDVDNVVAYGPETVTIPIQTTGVYRYSVHDYTSKSLTSSVALSLTGAQVRVYDGGTLLNTFFVPPGRGGTLWTVFEMDGDTKAITPINRMSYKSDEASIP